MSKLNSELNMAAKKVEVVSTVAQKSVNDERPVTGVNTIKEEKKMKKYVSRNYSLKTALLKAGIEAKAQKKAKASKAKKLAIKTKVEFRSAKAVKAAKANAEALKSANNKLGIVKEEKAMKKWIPIVTFGRVAAAQAFDSTPEECGIDREKLEKYFGHVWPKSHLGVIRNNLTRFGQKSVLIQSLKIYEAKKKVFVRSTIERQFSSEGLRQIGFHGGFCTLQNPIAAEEVNNGCLDIMPVEFGLISDTVSRIAVEAAAKIYVMRHSSLNHAFGVAYFAATEGEFRVIGQNRRFTTEEVTKGIAEGWVLEYRNLIPSVSQTRKGVMLYILANGLSHEDIVKKFDDISYGAFSLMLEVHKNKELAIDVAIKSLSRLSLPMTDSSPLGEIKNLAIFFGKFQYKDVVFADGHGFMMADSIQRWLAARDINLSLKEAMTMASQSRIGLIKGFNTGLTLDHLRAMVNFKLANGEIERVVRLPRTRETALELMTNKAAYKNCLVVIGDEDAINNGAISVDYMGDLTTFKHVWDFSRTVNCALMDMPVRFKGHVHTSKQIISDFQFAEGGVPLAVELGKRNVNDRLNGKTVPTDKDVQENGEETSPSEDSISLDISKEKFVTSAAVRMMPDIVKYDRIIWQQDLFAKVEGCLNDINHFKFTVSGCNAKVIPDLGGYLNVALLTRDEVYMPDTHVEEGHKYVGVRHPHASAQEHKIHQFVSLKTLISRVKTTELSKELQQVLIDQLVALPSGTAMVGSTDPHLVSYYSGMDFDGDMVTFIDESEIVALFEQIGEGYVEFGDVVKANDKLKISTEALSIAFRYAFGLWGANQHRNPSVGMAAGYLQTVKSLITMFNKGLLSGAWIAKVFGAKIGTEKYVRRYSGDTSFVGKELSFVADYIKSVKACSFTQQEVYDFLCDLSIICSKCINDIIDAAKKGNKVLIPFFEELNKAVISGVVAKENEEYFSVEYATLPDGTTGSNLVVTPLKKTGVGEKNQNGVYVLNDAMVQIRHTLAVYAHDTVEKKLKNIPPFAMVDYNSQLPTLRSTFEYLASIYSTMIREGINNKALCKDIMAKMVRNIAYHYAGVEDAETLFANAAVASFHGLNRDRQNSFYLSLISECFEHYINKFLPNAIFEKEVFAFNRGHVVQGQEITFVEGISHDGYYVADKITGTFDVDIRDGKAYIRCDYSDMIPDAERDNSVVLMPVNVNPKGYKSVREAYTAYVNLLEASRNNGQNIRTRLFKNERGYANVAVDVPYKDADGKDCVKTDTLYLGKNKTWYSSNGRRHYETEYYMDLVGDKEMEIIAIQCGTRTDHGNKMPSLYVLARIASTLERTVVLSADPVEEAAAKIAAKEEAAAKAAVIKANEAPVISTDIFAMANAEDYNFITDEIESKEEAKPEESSKTADAVETTNSIDEEDWGSYAAEDLDYYEEVAR